MELHGGNLIGSRRSAEGPAELAAINPLTEDRLAPAFHEATDEEIDAAVAAAHAAAEEYAATSPEARAAFLEAIAAAIHDLGDELLDRVLTETALPRPRLGGERGRTTGQLRLFADVVREGSWVGARIDRPDPERKPLPKPDVRRMLVPLGPVAVFGASNFPLAFSVAGGDTASALAAGCPVVVKAHPAHPGASEMVGRAIVEAAASAGMPDGVFSLVQGASNRVGERLVLHPRIRAVAFTGSLRGGRALYDLGAGRPEPIPVYAEMGSANPVFVLPGALAERGESIAEGMATSVLLGCGQFCTNPGVAVLPAGGAADAFVGRLGNLLGEAGPGTMVHPGIARAYEAALDEIAAVEGIQTLVRESAASDGPAAARAALFRADAAAWDAHERLRHEVYGPATTAVVCDEPGRMLEVARALDGHLTATVHGTESDLEENAELLAVLRSKVGRIVFNGYPTGVEVGHAMQHGGPYPATTDSRSTSVGTAAIERFARPVCWQDFPDAALPAELKDANPRGIWRMVDGELTREGR